MITKQQLLRQLSEMGLHPQDSIMIHSSMKAIGDVEGGADTVVDALMEYFSDGLLMTPTHTWRQMSETYNIFDPATEPACVGIIPNIFMHRPGVVRSLHPTHSIAAYGVGAADYIKDDETFHTPCDPKGCFGRLRDIHAKILLVGVTHARNTYIHSIEESMDVKERLTEKPVTFYVKLPDGTLKETAFHRHYNRLEPHISARFDMLMDYYYETGAAKQVRFGDAPCILCDAGALFDATCRVLEKTPDYFIPYEGIYSDR